MKFDLFSTRAISILRRWQFVIHVTILEFSKEYKILVMLLHWKHLENIIKKKKNTHPKQKPNIQASILLVVLCPK